MIDEPLHDFGGQRIDLATALHRAAIGFHIRYRIDQKLDLGRGPARRFHLLRDDGGEITARAVAADADIARFHAERACILLGPFIGSHGIIDGGGEFMLRRQAVIDGEDGAIGDFGKDRTEGVAGIEIADHAAAHVKIDEARQRPRRLFRAIEP